MEHHLIPSLNILVSSKIQMGLEKPMNQMIWVEINNMVALKTVKKKKILRINLEMIILKK